MNKRMANFHENVVTTFIPSPLQADNLVEKGTKLLLEIQQKSRDLGEFRTI